MEDIFYNVLWIDDEHETLSGTKGRAKRNGIKLIPFKSLNGGINELELNYHFYDGILLDAKFFENEGDVKDSEDTDYIHRAKEQILQLKKKFDVFVLTGQAEAYEDKTFKKAFRNVYKKGSDTEMDRLFTDIKQAAKTQEDTQIRHSYKRVFDICSVEYLGGASALTLLNTIKNANKENAVDSKDYFLTVRKLLELLFEKLNEIGLVPDAIFKSNGWFNPTSDFLTGKASEYTIKDDVIHPTVAFLLKQLKLVTQDAEHSLANRLRLKTDDFITENKTPYLFRSALNQLCDVLIWFKSFIDEHQNVDNSKTLYTHLEPSIVSSANNDWIKGEIYEINYSGWGKFMSECGKIELNIPDFLIREKDLIVGSSIELVRKPENEKHIKELRKN